MIGMMGPQLGEFLINMIATFVLLCANVRRFHVHFETELPTTGKYYKHKGKNVALVVFLRENVCTIIRSMYVMVVLKSYFWEFFCRETTVSDFRISQEPLYIFWPIYCQPPLF